MCIVEQVVSNNSHVRICWLLPPSDMGPTGRFRSGNISRASHTAAALCGRSPIIDIFRLTRLENLHQISTTFRRCEISYQTAGSGSRHMRSRRLPDTTCLYYAVSAKIRNRSVAAIIARSVFVTNVAEIVGYYEGTFARRYGYTIINTRLRQDQARSAPADAHIHLRQTHLIWYVSVDRL